MDEGERGLCRDEQGLTLLIPSPEGGWVDLACRQNWSGKGERYDQSGRKSHFGFVVVRRTPQLEIRLPHGKDLV